MNLEEQKIEDKIKNRDYEIYIRMPYRLAEKKYHSSEIYPIANKTISLVNEQINEKVETKGMKY